MPSSAQMYLASFLDSQAEHHPAIFRNLKLVLRSEPADLLSNDFLLQILVRTR